MQVSFSMTVVAWLGLAQELTERAVEIGSKRAC
jgi:hypothetical protein